MKLCELSTAVFHAESSYVQELPEETIEREVLRRPDCWTRSSVDSSWIPSVEAVALFDQNGYDLTYLEQVFAHHHRFRVQLHRNESHYSLRNNWLVDSESVGSAGDSHHGLGQIHLNHSFLFERKSFERNALRQLLQWIRLGATPQLYKLVHMRAKWGIDLSVDFASKDHAFEVVHFEWDSFVPTQAMEIKRRVARLFTSFTAEKWREVVEELIQLYEEWSSLPFFEQSDWKCNYFGLPKEQFKMVCWSTTDA